MCQGRCPEVGKCGGEVVGVHDRAVRKGGGQVELKNPELSSCSLVFMNY